MAGLWAKRMMMAVYTVLALGANPVAADPALAALRQGDMRKLVVLSQPVPAGQAMFFDPAGGQHRLADWQGKVVVLNFWATWCAPCRAEMPSLDALNIWAPDGVEVVTVATGRNPLPAIEKFWETAAITTLPVLLDPKSALAREMGVAGLPVTVILDKQGREAARMIGEAEWNSDAARALLTELAAR